MATPAPRGVVIELGAFAVPDAAYTSSSRFEFGDPHPPAECGRLPRSSRAFTADLRDERPVKNQQAIDPWAS